MDYIFCGTNVYAIRNGIQLSDCLVYSDSNLGYKSLPPSILAQLRDTADKKPIYISLLFSKIIDTNGILLPSDDLNRLEPTYSLLKGISIEALEVPSFVIGNIINDIKTVNGYFEYLKILQKFLSSPDLTRSAIDSIVIKIESILAILLSYTFSVSLTLGPNNNNPSTYSFSGFPVPGSFSYMYQPRWDFGSLKLKLVSNA